MALPICLEASIRLILEVVRFLVGDVSIIWNEGLTEYLSIGIPVIMSNIFFFGIFIAIAIVCKNRVVRAAILTGIPAVINAVVDFGTPISGGATQAFVLVGAFVSAICWVFLIVSESKINIVLRFAAIPAAIVLGFINALQPASIIGDAVAFLGFAFFAQIVGYACLIIYGLIIIISPTGICTLFNEYMRFAADWRNEGFWGALKMLFGYSALVFINKKIFICPDNKLK